MLVVKTGGFGGEGRMAVRVCRTSLRRNRAEKGAAPQVDPAVDQRRRGVEGVVEVVGGDSPRMPVRP